MNKNYTGYTAEQLLNDDFFIHSELHPTEETRLFWLNLERTDLSLAKEIRMARMLMNRFRQDVSRPLLPASEVSDLWNKIQRENQPKKRFQLFRYGVAAAVAAILVLALTIPYLLPEKEIDYQTIIADLSAEKEQDEVQLVFSNEEKVLISEEGSKISYDEKGEVRVNSESIRKQSVQHKNEDEVQLNKLIVPAGKLSFLTLSDGTKLWVNSSTKVVYPHLFKGDKREIYVDGEVYLEVTRNPDKPFYVKTEQMSVRVLGTSFNVCAYPEDIQQQVVLVNGKVEVQSQAHTAEVLAPNELYEYDKQTEETSIKEVDATDYISWKNGYYQFAGQQLSVLFKRLSRYYAVSIVCDEKVGALNCSGKLDLTEHVDDVLENLSKAAPIKVEHDHEQIIIKYEPLN